MNHATKLAAALLALAAAAPAAAVCTPAGQGGVCVDALQYIEEDPAANAIQFRMLAGDESALACTKVDGGFQIARTETMFNERHQLLLLAAAGALQVRVEISNTPGTCVVSSVRLLSQ